MLYSVYNYEESEHMLVYFGTSCPSVELLNEKVRLWDSSLYQGGQSLQNKTSVMEIMILK